MYGLSVAVSVSLLLLPWKPNRESPSFVTATAQPAKPKLCPLWPSAEKVCQAQISGKVLRGHCRLLSRVNQGEGLEMGQLELMCDRLLFSFIGGGGRGQAGRLYMPCSCSFAPGSHAPAEQRWQRTMIMPHPPWQKIGNRERMVRTGYPETWTPSHQWAALL